jgi:hypothetical protein
MKKSLQLSIVITMAFLFTSCWKNHDAKIVKYQISGNPATIQLDGHNKTVNITFPTNVTVANPLIADFDLSEGAVAYVSNIIQVPGVTQNNFEMPFSYIVKAEDKKTTAEWKVISTNNSVTLKWGLGGFQTQSKFNNRAYSFYIDQKNTGTYSSVNCGPTATTMASKWSYAAYTKTPEDARAAYRPSGGWWYTSDIHNWLVDNSIPHRFISLSVNAAATQLILKEKLDSGKVVILCVDMDKVRSGPADDRRIDKFYSTSPNWGHFLLVKGYRKVENEFYYELYDPNSWGQVYTTGELKGMDRYYRTSDIYDATSIWWNYAIVIYEKGTKSVSYIQDISSFPVAWGR